MILWDREAGEGALELMRIVVRHLVLQLVLGIEKLQLSHQLTAVADAETQRIGTSVEALECGLRLLVVEDTGSPTLC